MLSPRPFSISDRAFWRRDVAELGHLAQHLVAARLVVPSRLSTGEYCDGACGMPASIAASRSVRSLTFLSKYRRAAAPAPIAVWPP